MKLATDTCELIGGPQDGAKVHSVTKEWPEVLHLGPKNLGDGYAAWSDEKCQRFPAVYLYSGYGRYRFLGSDSA